MTVHLLSFPLWLDAWYNLLTISALRVDGNSVSQLYEMRSDKEERRAGGFPPDDDEVVGLAPQDEEGGSSTAIVPSRGAERRGSSTRAQLGGAAKAVRRGRGN